MLTLRRVQDAHLGKLARVPRPKRVPLWVTLGIGVALTFFLISIYGFLAVSNPVGEGVESS